MRARRPALMLMLAVLILGVGAGLRDRLDDWVAATTLPRLDVPVGTEVLARDGSLLRAFQVADGRWRLDPGPVDPLFLDMLQPEQVLHVLDDGRLPRDGRSWADPAAERPPE